LKKVHIETAYMKAVIMTSLVRATLLLVICWGAISCRRGGAEAQLPVCRPIAPNGASISG